MDRSLEEVGGAGDVHCEVEPVDRLHLVHWGERQLKVIPAGVLGVELRVIRIGLADDLDNSTDSARFRIAVIEKRLVAYLQIFR